VSDRDIDHEVVRLARVLQSSMHEILASVVNLGPADLAAAMRATEPLRLVSHQLDQALAEYDRLQKPLDLPVCRERQPQRTIRGGCRTGPSRRGADRPG
jgi:hypothetical protein